MATLKGEKGFASKIGFIFAAAGSAVGLGNLWRFPWQVSRYGGGAFVLVYLIMVLLLGSTVMIAEIGLGRITRGTVVDAYGKGGKGMKWLGLLAVFVPFFIVAYYTVIGGWSANYTLNYIFDKAYVANAGGAGNYFGQYITSSYKAPLLSVAFLVITILIVAKGVDKGIEKASKVLFPTLFVMIVFLAIFAVALPTQEGAAGAAAGMKYYMGNFDFKALGWNGVVAAMSQSFFSLSLGMGIMVAYGSYTGKEMRIGSSALIVCGLDTLIALIGGFIVFPTIFAVSPNAAELASSSGPGLLFIVLPGLFDSMPGGQLFGFIFFLLVAFAALTSLISLLEVVTQFTKNRLGWTRKKATWTFGVVLATLAMIISLSFSDKSGFMLAGKVDLLTYFDEITNQILMPIVAFGSVFTVTWLIKRSDLLKAFEESKTTFGKSKHRDKFRDVWYYITKFVAPPLILLVLIMGIVGNFQNAKNGKGDFAGFGMTYGVVLIGALIFTIVAVIGNIYLNSNKFQALVKQVSKVKFGNEDADYQYDSEESTALVDEANQAEETSLNEEIIEEEIIEE